MGNCCVASASSHDKATPSSPASAKITPSASDKATTFKWSIDNFYSLLDKGETWTYSRVFKMMGHDWYLKLNPMDRSCGEECVSLRLELSSVEPNTTVEAFFILIIYDQSYGKHSEYRVRHAFQTASTSSGKSCMIKLATLKNSYGFIVNNNCVFGVKFIEVVTTKAETTSEKLYVKNTSTLPETKAYTWYIADFFGLEKEVYSPEFTASGYKWSIKLVKEENHISLHLTKMINDLPEDYAVQVELTLSIKNQEEGGNHLKNKGRAQFSNKNRIWGFQNFVSMEDMQDSSNGYLIKNKCCIEAEVTIDGSSRMK